MRTLVDIPEQELELLNQLSKTAEVSRAELIRRAVSAYLKPYKQAGLTDAFGLWSGREKPVDGLAYQEKVRREWR